MFNAAKLTYNKDELNVNINLAASYLLIKLCQSRLTKTFVLPALTICT